MNKNLSSGVFLPAATPITLAQTTIPDDPSVAGQFKCEYAVNERGLTPPGVIAHHHGDKCEELK
jgi:hypothetical protein